PRWENVIRPGLAAIRVNGVPLEPYRVDVGKVSDSILTEILDEIARSRIFIAEISEIGKLDDRSIRNANVMYEVGLAQAVRLPEEVLLVRSDKEQLLFDITNVRVHYYEPDTDVGKASALLGELALESLRAVEQKKHLAV